MKTKIRKLLILAFWVFPAGTLLSCAAGTLESDLALSHPAHPQATEATYRPQPNPFHGGVSEMNYPDGNQNKTDSTAQHQDRMSDDHGGHSMEPSQETSTADPPGMKHTDKPHGGHGQ